MTLPYTCKLTDTGILEWIETPDMLFTPPKHIEACPICETQEMLCYVYNTKVSADNPDKVDTEFYGKFCTKCLYESGIIHAR